MAEPGDDRTSPAVRAPRRAAAQWVLAVVAALGVPLTPVLGHLLPPYRNPESFWAPVVALVLLIVALVWVARPWWASPRRRARVADHGFVLGVLVGAGLTYVMVRELATAYGIRTSAIPRLRQGIAMPVDLPYVVANALIVTVAVLALGLVGLHLRARRAPPPTVLPTSWVPADQASHGENAWPRYDSSDHEPGSAVRDPARSNPQRSRWPRHSEAPEDGDRADHG